MNIQRRLDELAKEAEACGECMLNAYTGRHLMPYVDDHWARLLRLIVPGEPVEMGKEDLEDLTETVRANLVASVAAKLTA